MSRVERTQALAHGNWAEGFVASALIEEGWTIAARRWRGGGGELDIVATRADDVAFVEVKSASKGRISPDRLGRAQRHRLVSAAEAWLDTHPLRGEAHFRVAFVTGGPNAADLEWFTDAFDCE